MSTAPLHLTHHAPLAVDGRVPGHRLRLRLAIADATHAAALALGVAGLGAVAALPFAATLVLG